MKNSTRSTFVVKILAIALAASALMFQAHSAFAEDEDFGYGFDASDISSFPGTATWIYPTELGTGVGNLDETDVIDSYSFQTPSSGAVTVYLSFPGNESNPVYARVFDSEGVEVTNGFDPLYASSEQSYDYITIQYRPDEVFYVMVYAIGNIATYGLSFSGLY